MKNTLRNIFIYVRTKFTFNRTNDDDDDADKFILITPFTDFV